MEPYNDTELLAKANFLANKANNLLGARLNNSSNAVDELEIALRDFEEAILFNAKLKVSKP